MDPTLWILQFRSNTLGPTLWTLQYGLLYQLGSIMYSLISYDLILSGKKYAVRGVR